MSLLGKMVTKAVVNTAENTIGKKLLTHIENTRSLDALTANSSAAIKLIIKKRGLSNTNSSSNRKFDVFDEAGTKKYFIKRDAISFGCPCTRLFDASDKEIGRVEQYGFKTSRKHQLYLDNQEIGVVILKLSKKQGLDLSFNGWHLEIDFLRGHFFVTDKTGNTVIKYTLAYDSRGTHLLEINNTENEQLGLLMFMLIDINH